MKIKKKALLLSILVGFFSINPFYIGNTYADDDSDDPFSEEKQAIEEQRNRDFYVSADFKTDFDPFLQDSRDSLKFTLKNNGKVRFERGTVNVTLPSGISLANSKSPKIDIGQMQLDDSLDLKYDVVIPKDVKPGNYPVTFEFKGMYGTEVKNYKEYTTSRTVYMKVVKKDAEKKDEKNDLKPLLIYDIKHPAIINKGDVANLTFKVKNPNPEDVKSVKISIIPEDGIVNKTQNIFVENKFSPDEIKTFSVQLFGKDKVDKKNYSIKISAEPNDAPQITPTQTDEDDDKKIKILPPSTQYTGIFYNIQNDDDKDKKDDGVKKPQIMIDNYNYGDKSKIQPNSSFTLYMDFVNTSDKQLRNIKVSLNSDENTFIADSSNSFFVDSMTPGSRVTKSMNFTVKPDATTKTVPMNIDYSYEDMKGNPIEAKDTISIPVMQKTLLSIDEIQKPVDAMIGEPINISANFYNLGKTPISNLKIVASGDFTVDGDSSYFVGNLDPGKDDSFSVNAIPNDPHHISGKMVFTFETLDGKQNSIEKPFDFKLNPIEMPQPDMEDPSLNPPKTSMKKKVLIGLAGLAAVVIVFVFIKKRRDKKKNQELDIDE